MASRVRPAVPPRADSTFLIVCLRYIGDVLLSTPLALSIKTHLPRAQVDYLVFKGTEEALANNPHVRSVHTLPPGSIGLATLVRLWRQYDFALGAGWSDRTAIFSFACGRHSQGFCSNARQDWWKRFLLQRHLTLDGRQHVVPMLLSQLEPLGIPPIPRVVLRYNSADAEFVRTQLGQRPCILLHPYSRRSFKYWPASAWAQLAEMIRSRTQFRAVFTRSLHPSDQEQLQRIERASRGGVDTIPQPLTLCQLAAAIQGSRAFVGIDTAATHVAAAVGAPTIAIYGPTSALLWGPWPNESRQQTPFAARGPSQSCGSVTVVQQRWPCTPCSRETCFISRRAKIECLEDLPPEIVFTAVARAVSSQPPH